jgi:PRC-barrel domain protein
MTSLNTSLRYIDAGHVDTPDGRLGRATLVSRSNAPLGKLDGIVIDPMSRQVRYYVVESPGWLTTRHYLLPLTPARLDRDRHAVEVDLDADDLKQLDEVEPDDLPRYSDEDLLASMFHSQL